MSAEEEVLEEEQMSEIQLPQQEEEEQPEAVEKQDSEETIHEETEKETKPKNNGPDRSGFLHGLSVGLGIGCIATFVIMWITIFFTPIVPSAATYESLLAIFIYPLIYLLAVGLVALTAGIVREYYSRVR